MVEPLVTRWPSHSPEEIEAVAEVLRSGKVNYWQGEHGQALEQEWSRAIGLPYALTVANGTVALECALRGLSFDEWCAENGPYDVLVPARTFMATASAVATVGGRPVLADIDPATLCVTSRTLAAAKTPETAGVIVVHYAGLPVPDMDSIVRWCMSEKLWIIEDAAHAHLAPTVGLRSHVATWSNCVGKIMSTGGEGGFVATSDRDVAGRMAAWRDHGRYQLTGRRDMSGAGKAWHEFDYCVEDFGTNIRQTEMQSVLGRYALRRLPKEIARRRWIAAQYDAALGERAMYTVEQRTDHVRYLYHVSTPEKARVMQALNALGIPARFGGCDNIGKEPVFQGLARSCPGAEIAGHETFSIPCYPTMTDAEVERVCAGLHEVMR